MIMRYRQLILPLIVAILPFASMSAHASYVIEADALSFSASSENAMSPVVNFDFVTHDFGVEPTDAIQIALTNLTSSVGLRGNLLLWSHVAIGNSALQDTSVFDLPPVTRADIVVADDFGDFSYYDEGATDIGQDGSGVIGAGGNGAALGTTAAVIEPLPASVRNLPAIDSGEIFWILKPANFESFSQMIAARFGF
jgi:hypothetical protein